jgi:hypothetical protein
MSGDEAARGLGFTFCRTKGPAYRDYVAFPFGVLSPRPNHTVTFSL